MSILLLVVGMMTSFTLVMSHRAIPLSAENYAIKHFKTINPTLEYDESNFLVDLSGQFVQCDRVGSARGYFAVQKTTKAGEPIAGLMDYDFGGASHVNAVNQYIMDTIVHWTQYPKFAAVIANSQKFGCSVRPACGGSFVIGCLFSGPAPIIDPTPRPTPDGGDEFTQHALAFTQQQYNMAAHLTGKPWDRSHYLENLSGYETECAMIGSADWNFMKAAQIAAKKGIHVNGLFGHALNEGETQPAMEIILRNFVQKEGLYSASKPQPESVGCSLIPDCVMPGGGMYVVIGCLYTTV